jgi:asparagine synthase (glutamine-hydrolysing)
VEALAQEMAKRLARGPATGAETATHRGAAVATTQINGADLFREGTRLTAIHGTPSFSDPTMAAIADQSGPAAALAEGVSRLGPSVFERVGDSFSAAWLDAESGEALIAIDRIGGRCPLVYYQEDDLLVFGSSAAALDVHPAAATRLDPQGIYNFLFFYMVPGPGTVRRDVSRLLPGCYLHLRGGIATVAPYFALEFEERCITPVQELEHEFHDVLRKSVSAQLDGAVTASFLSGGTDSSTVAGLATELGGDGARRSYSIGFDARGYDEMSFARTASRHFGTEHHEYYVTPSDVADLIPRIAEVFADPFGNESAVPTYLCAHRAREDGVERMLAGDGGDELFAGNQRYDFQRMFSLYDRVPSPLRALLEAVIFGLPAGEHVAPVRKARNYIRYARAPMPRRLQSYNYLERLGRERILEPEFLATVNPEQPFELMAEVYHGAHAGTMLNRMLAMDARFTLADNDLQKVSRMGELAGVEIRYPLLSDSMVDFARRLSPALKLKPGELRWFWKHALRDYLPQEVLTKQKHGFGLPFGIWLREDPRLREIVEDSLGGLKGRGIVRPEFIDELLNLHNGEQADYYGVILWVLMMLELWFRNYGDDLHS